MSKKISSKRISRREFLRASALSAGGLVLAACAPSAPPATSQPATPQVVEKTVEVVKQVEKVVTATPMPAAKTAQLKEVPRNKTLIIVFEGGPYMTPDLWNPYLPGSMRQSGFHQCGNESLWYLNYETGKMEPWLAESYTFNSDYTECTFKLRKGVTWSDGVAFTAKDVEFTVNMIKNTPGLTYFPFDPSTVKSVKAVDDQTVTFTLNGAFPRFPLNFFAVHLWGTTTILPEHIFSKQADLTTFKHFDLEKGWPVGTGAYKLVKSTQNEIVWDRRDDWWGAKTGFHPLPTPERVIFTYPGTPEKEAAALQNNEADGLPAITAGTFEAVRAKNPKIIAWSDKSPYGWTDPCPTCATINSEVKPWDDPEMRWALNYAIDKQQYANAYVEGDGGTVARWVTPNYPPLEAYLDENKDLFQKYPVTEFSREKARAIFRKKGYTEDGKGMFSKDGKPLQITILASRGAAWTAVLPLLNQYWREVGVDSVIKWVGQAEYGTRRGTGDYEVDTQTYCSSVVDPHKAFDVLHSKWIKPVGQPGQINYARYKNPEIDKIADAISKLPVGDPAIKPLFRQGLEITLRDMAPIVISQAVRIVPYNTTYWTGFPTAKTNWVHPPNWWALFYRTILELKPSQA